MKYPFYVDMILMDRHPAWPRARSWAVQRWEGPWHEVCQVFIGSSDSLSDAIDHLMVPTAYSLTMKHKVDHWSLLESVGEEDGMVTWTAVNGNNEVMDLHLSLHPIP